VKVWLPMPSTVIGVDLFESLYGMLRTIQLYAHWQAPVEASVVGGWFPALDVLPGSALSLVLPVQPARKFFCVTSL